MNAASELKNIVLSLPQLYTSDEVRSKIQLLTFDTLEMYTYYKVNDRPYNLHVLRNAGKPVIAIMERSTSGNTEFNARYQCKDSLHIVSIPRKSTEMLREISILQKKEVEIYFH